MDERERKEKDRGDWCEARKEREDPPWNKRLNIFGQPHLFLSSQHHDRDGVWNSSRLSRGATGILTDTRPDFLQSRKLSESLISIDTADTEIILEFDCSVP
jgi:hypothetical protein